MLSLIKFQELQMIQIFKTNIYHLANPNKNLKPGNLQQNVQSKMNIQNKP